MYFFLILIGIVILFIGIKSNKKQKPTFTKILHKEEIDIDAIDIVIGELRMEFSSTILELQKDVMELSEKLDAFMKTDQHEGSSISIENIENQIPPRVVSTQRDKSTNVDTERIKNEALNISTKKIEKEKSPKGGASKKDKSTKVVIEQIETEVFPISIEKIENEKSPKDVVQQRINTPTVAIEQIKNEISPKAYANENENKNSSKISEISELLEKGFSIDEICEKVDMGRGEILLIKELYLK